MGEATYTLTAEFETPNQAKAAVPKVQEFLNRLWALYEEWQDGRGFRGAGFTQETFTALCQKHGDVLGLMEISQPECPHNGFAGKLSPPDDPRVRQDGDKVIYSGVTWHLADWGTHVTAMKNLGAQTARWESDEW